MNIDLQISCKAVVEITGYARSLEITLEDIEPDFIEDLKPEDIILYHDNEKLLEQMDSDEIMSYLEKNYSVEIKELR